ncbi:MAG: DUF488 family protein [Pseudomonadota bacterium]
MTRIQVKRIYNPPSKSDGYRILVDRLWPRGLSKQNARLDQWFPEIAPSEELRKWFNHDADLWFEFKKRYFEELNRNSTHTQKLIELMQSQSETITLLYASKEESHNNAQALLSFLLEKEVW